jgi:hypothetical protein
MVVLGHLAVVAVQALLAQLALHQVLVEMVETERLIL